MNNQNKPKTKYEFHVFIRIKQAAEHSIAQTVVFRFGKLYAFKEKLYEYTTVPRAKLKAFIAVMSDSKLRIPNVLVITDNDYLKIVATRFATDLNYEKQKSTDVATRTTQLITRKYDYSKRPNADLFSQIKGVVKNGSQVVTFLKDSEDFLLGKVAEAKAFLKNQERRKHLKPKQKDAPKVTRNNQFDLDDEMAVLRLLDQKNMGRKYSEQLYQKRVFVPKVIIRRPGR